MNTTLKSLINKALAEADTSMKKESAAKVPSGRLVSRETSEIEKISSALDFISGNLRAIERSPSEKLAELEAFVATISGEVPEGFAPTGLSPGDPSTVIPNDLLKVDPTKGQTQVYPSANSNSPIPLETGLTSVRPTDSSTAVPTDDIARLAFAEDKVASADPGMGAALGMSLGYIIGGMAGANSAYNNVDERALRDSSLNARERNDAREIAANQGALGGIIGGTTVGAIGGALGGMLHPGVGAVAGGALGGLAGYALGKAVKGDMAVAGAKAQTIFEEEMDRRRLEEIRKTASVNRVYALLKMASDLDNPAEISMSTEDPPLTSPDPIGTPIGGKAVILPVQSNESVIATSPLTVTNSNKQQMLQFISEDGLDTTLEENFDTTKAASLRRVLDHLKGHSGAIGRNDLANIKEASVQADYSMSKIKNALAAVAYDEWEE